MTGTDVAQLEKETLPPEEFPAPRRAEFRAFFDPAVHGGIHRHASEDTSVEICGVLVGTWKRDDDGPFVEISNYIRTDTATSRNAEVTFTHESWDHINAEMDSKYADKRIVGWYHSHPDFGIFLSDRDVFIHEHFFSGPGQVALVVDPVRDLEGLFEWRDGKPALMRQYWVGDRVVTDASSRSTAPRPTNRERTAVSPAAAASAEHAAREPTSSAMLSAATTALAWTCLFLLGYLLAGWRTSWEQRYIAEGAIAHYGVWNLLQHGRSEQIEEARQRIDLAFDEIGQLAEEHQELLEGEERAKLRKRWTAARRQLANTRKTLDRLESRYALTPEEREIAERVIVEKVAALTGVKVKDDQLGKVMLQVPIERQTRDSDAGQRGESAGKVDGPRSESPGGSESGPDKSASDDVSNSDPNDQ